MELSLYTDSVSHLPFEQALDYAAGLGITAVEIAAGGQSSAPHMRAAELLDEPAALSRYRAALETRGLRLAAVNCSAWPLHPTKGEQHTTTIKAAIRVAGQLGAGKIVTMSGCPADSPGSPIVNWITFPWPAQNPDDPTSRDIQAVHHRQWEQAIAYWRTMAAYAADHGVTRIAVELHPVHLVYNTPSLLRLHGEVGEIIGANVDPSHMFWQQMDPIAVIRALGPAIHHVHLKDLQFHQDNLALSGVLDLVPFEQPAQRAWIFRTIGQGHGPEFWSDFITALHDAGYDDVLSIENEDPTQPAEDGVSQAAEFIRGLLSSRAAGAR